VGLAWALAGGQSLCLQSALAFQDAPGPAMSAEASPASAVPVEQNAPVEEPKSFLWWLIDVSGPFGACIFIESFIMVSLTIMFLLQMRRSIFMPPDFVAEFERKLTARDYQGAFNLAKEDESFLARLLVVGMAKLQRGPEEAMAAMTELGEDENMGHEHRLSWLALIATTAPMFGLLGTVQGMVRAFNEIATSNTTPKPSELAEGIQLALVTTLEGLVVAIPAMIAYSLMRNHLVRLMFDIGHLAEDLMKRMQSRPATPAPATPSA
jgi:biopolymer transport protein ExbB